MFKKIIFGFFITLLSVNLYAGDYEGAWLLEGENELVMVHQNGAQLLMVGLESDMSGWWADMGTISGNTATMTSLLNGFNTTLEFTMTFTSSTRATAIITSCTSSGSSCNDAETSPGASFVYNKIF